MDWFTGTIVYFLIWWTALFMVLPWRLEKKKSVKPEEGIVGAPVNPKIKEKFIATTILSAVIWIVIYILIEMGIVDFRQLAEDMSRAGI